MTPPAGFGSSQTAGTATASGHAHQAARRPSSPCRARRPGSRPSHSAPGHRQGPISPPWRPHGPGRSCRSGLPSAVTRYCGTLFGARTGSMTPNGGLLNQPGGGRYAPQDPRQPDLTPCPDALSWRTRTGSRAPSGTWSAARLPAVPVWHAARPYVRLPGDLWLMRAIRDPAEREGVILAASSRTYTEQRLREESPFPGAPLRNRTV